jgi:flagellar biosynthesis/type III secretory pathway protein FliH
MEGEIVDLCLSVSEKVVNAAIDRDDAYFRSIIENALGKVRREGKVRVQVCPEDFERFFGSDTASFSVQGEEVVVSVAANNRLHTGGCIVETDSDRADTGVSTMIDGMRKALKTAR